MLRHTAVIPPCLIIRAVTYLPHSPHQLLPSTVVVFVLSGSRGRGVTRDTFLHDPHGFLPHRCCLVLLIPHSLRRQHERLHPQGMGVLHFQVGGLGDLADYLPRRDLRGGLEHGLGLREFGQAHREHHLLLGDVLVRVVLAVLPPRSVHVLALGRCVVGRRPGVLQGALRGRLELLVGSQVVQAYRGFQRGQFLESENSCSECVRLKRDTGSHSIQTLQQNALNVQRFIYFGKPRTRNALEYGNGDYPRHLVSSFERNEQMYKLNK